MKMRLLLTFAAALALAVRASGADVGPGDQIINGHTSELTSLYIDMGGAQALSAGSYTADTFNYQFSTAPDWQFPNGGTVTPFLATSPSLGVFTTIAIGDSVTYGGDTPFHSVAFGGSNAFTLASADTIYAAFYHTASTGLSNPIGLLSGGGLMQQFDNPSFPTVGNNTDGNSLGIFGREFDFSITVNPVPEPSSFVLLSVSVVALIGLARKTRRRV